MRAAVSSSKPDAWTSRLAALAIIAAVLLAFHGTFAVPFFFDDDIAIVQNPTIRDLASIATVLSPPNNGSGVTGRPLVNLSLALNYAVGRTHPRGYHLVNVVLHAACSVTLFALARRTFSQQAFHARYRNASTGLAFAVALIWSIHPLQTESVACVIQRTELLVAFFLLLTLYGSVRAAEANRPGRWTAFTVAACALGMASKEVMVVAPLLVVLYDRTFVAGTFPAAFRQRRALYAGLAATWLILFALLITTGGRRGPAAGFGLGVSWWSYALKQCDAVVSYVRLALWPHPLIIDYGTEVIRDPLRVLPQLVVLTGLVVTTAFALRSRPKLGFVLVCFFAILAPSSSVVPLVTQTMAEHRMYLPLASVIALGVVVAYDALPRSRAIAAGLIAFACVLLTTARNRTLQDEIALWSETVANLPTNARAHASLGLALSDRGEPHHALPHFQRALELDPASFATEVNLGNAFYRLGEFAEAAAHFRRAITLDPKSASAHNNLGAALLELRDRTGAQLNFERAIALDPSLQSARENLARLRAATTP